ncbi:hypothetical protein RKE29_26470 [Streptomyces sp. B1866]|uniref:hypothetical protein n=1 Tax=Streptomyces sp. B1866 TaxID=3075431 RepID=UPI00288EE640|nr:hypothetical protein [Streptomyces sp. B1866]MDT3400125.1 hypothetical protein [Streptomyces sp. B1866]
MIVGMIAASEIGFWVFLVAGLSVRYLLRRPRAGAVLLACVPLVDVALLVATVVDLRRGAEPSTLHGLAALYLGFSVAYGHYLISWADGRFAHRFAGGPPPVRPPKYGRERIRHEWRLWRMTLVAGAVAAAVLQACVWLVDDPDRTEALTANQWLAARVVGIHLLVAVCYTLWPPKPKPKPKPGQEPQAPAADASRTPPAGPTGSPAAPADRGGPARRA